MLSQISFAQSTVLHFFSLDSWTNIVYLHTYLEPHFQDDDSDLECELEAFPPVSVECASEAAACVKVNMLALIIMHSISICYALDSYMIII